ncbi:MAG: hypothetical protein ABWK00_04495 [Desulfurococcaceae archaeon]
MVGAFAYPLARLLGLRDVLGKRRWRGSGALITDAMEAFLDSTLAASAGVAADSPSGLVTHSELSRISAPMYKGATEKGRMRAEPFSPEFYEEALARIFPVQAVGSAYAPGARLLLSWVVDVARLSKALGVGEEDVDAAGPIAAKAVSRIGSKEGIVAPEPELSGYAKSPKVIEGGKIRTLQYVLEECADPIYEVPSVELPYLDYGLRRFYVPARHGSNNVLVPWSRGARPPPFELKGGCRAYAPPDEALEAFTSVGA